MGQCCWLVGVSGQGEELQTQPHRTEGWLGCVLPGRTATAMHHFESWQTRVWEMLEKTAISMSIHHLLGAFFCNYAHFQAPFCPQNWIAVNCLLPVIPSKASYCMTEYYRAMPTIKHNFVAQDSQEWWSPAEPLSVPCYLQSIYLCCPVFSVSLINLHPQQNTQAVMSNCYLNSLWVHGSLHQQENCYYLSMCQQKTMPDNVC